MWKSAPFQASIRHHVIQTIGSMMVLIRLLATSICQSDRRIQLGTKGSALAERPVILGHEGGGVVMDVGSGVSGLKPGDHVVVLPHKACGECEACLANTPNLCKQLKHLGFHFHGLFTELGVFPAGIVYPVGNTFPHHCFPLVEPTACSIRGVSLASPVLSRLAAQRSGAYVFLHGGGPMGCLLCRVLRRVYPNLYLCIIEPHPRRRRAVRRLGIADRVVQQVPDGSVCDISFIASSNLAASRCAIQTTKLGGTVILFAGINEDELTGTTLEEARFWEQVHRRELQAEPDGCYSHGRRLVGSSGYTVKEVEIARDELVRFGRHYDIVQNVIVHGLEATEALYLGPPARTRSFDRTVVEALLAPRGIDDPCYGQAIADALKVLILM